MDEVSEPDRTRLCADHRMIFKALPTGRGQPLNVITLSETLEREGVLEQAGVWRIRVNWRNRRQCINIAAYADIVRERSMVRQLIGVARCRCRF